MLLLPRFYDPASGTVSIDGVDVRDVTLESLRSAIGIVQQDVYLFGGVRYRKTSPTENYGASDERDVAAAKRASIHDFICSLPDGYDTIVGERGARLLAGQQRVAIARVFLRNPRILILDEATSALDNESERAIQLSLEELSRGRTTLISHRLSLFATLRRSRSSSAGAWWSRGRTKSFWLLEARSPLLRDAIRWRFVDCAVAGGLKSVRGRGRA